MSNFNIRTTRNQPDGPILVSIPQGESDHARSSLILFGKNFANYGTAFNENLVGLMENFANITPPPNPLEGQLWYDITSSDLKIYQRAPQGGFEWALINASSLQSIAESLVPNRIYVSKNGNDSNSGQSWFTAKRTIKAACLTVADLVVAGAVEPQHVTILVGSGDYQEDTPIAVPDGTSIIGDNLRSVTVRPKTDPTKNVFQLGSGCYVYGLTVRGHQLSPSALDITPTPSALDTTVYAGANGNNLPRSTIQTGFAFTFRPQATITVSPYIQNCSSISGDSFTNSGANPGGGGVLVDSDDISNSSRIHSIVVDAFTQINLGGIGVKVVNKGYMQLVSFFVNFCQIGILCVNGGHVTALNSNCSFGNYALWSEGYRFLDNAPQDGQPGSVNQTWTLNAANNKQFTTTTNYKALPDQIEYLTVSVTVGGSPYTSQIFTVASVTDGNNNNSVITLNDPPPVNSNVTIKTRFGSLIEASGYTMSYAGAGISYSRLSASQGGVGRADPNKYTICKIEPSIESPSVAARYGRIYHTTTDESGDFYVGVVTPGNYDTQTSTQDVAKPTFRINQRKGIIDGRAFYQSMFGFMAPLVLALTRRTK
jgi:hypothetical protein